MLPPKFHPEIAGVEIEYSWVMSKIKYRRELKDEVPKYPHRNIVASMRPETILTLLPVRRFARHARDFKCCRGYLKLAKDGEEADSKGKIERMRKTSKAHRNIIDMEPGFLDKQL